MNLSIDKSWTLFLDRDGVLNKEKNNDYIYNWSEFNFYDGVFEAMKKFNSLFDTIVIVTNQKGVGKQLMTQKDLDDIHEKLQHTVEINDGRIDKVYVCTDLDQNSFNRKPNIGMALQAQEDFPSINFTKSIMVGNKMSDMQFGKNANMKTVFVATTHPETPFPNEFTDFRFDDLLAFAKALKNS